MKTIKKIFALLLALTVIIALSATAFAAGEGSITVNGTTAGKTYDAYKIFDLTYTGTAPNASAAYTIDTDWTAFFAGAGAAYIVDNNNAGGTLNQIIIGGNIKYIDITEANVAAFAQEALKYAAAKTADATDVATVASLTFDNLDLGYYLVYPQGATDITDGNASLCSLTSTVPNGTVNVKASYPTISKIVDDANVDIGQTVKYTITGKVPDTTGYDEYSYKVSDTLSAGLTLNKGDTDFIVKINGTEITTVEPVYLDNGFTLTFDMTEFQASVGQAVEISYTAVVNANAVIGTDGNPNSATLEYSNDPTDATSKITTPPVVVNVYTATIEILKVDGADTTKKLSGAQFVLMDDAGKYYKFTAATDTTPEKVEWVDARDDATVVISGNDGEAYFRGLESDTYRVVEIKAPSGYNLLTTPAIITINHEGQTATTFTQLEVKNNTGSTLPETGGIGTTIFYVTGGVLMAGAVVLLITKKRMAASKSDD